MVISANDNKNYLLQALDSICKKQTRLADEYVFVRNGTLATALDEILVDFEKRNYSIVKLIDRPIMGSLSEALNDGLSFCSGDLVARMDPDDIAMSTRFAKQLSVFQKNPMIDICGSWIGEFDNNPEQMVLRQLPQENEKIIAYAKWRNPLAHPSVMYRKQSILDVGGYPSVDKAQDYLLWVMGILKGYELFNIPEPLLLFRSGNAHMDRRGWSYFKSEFEVLKRMQHMGFLSLRQYILNIILRCILRCQPVFIKRLIYKIRS